MRDGAAPEAAQGLRLAGVTKRFGAVRAVGDVSLDVAAGELFTLLGPSGCGKTTLLRLVAGILQADAGRILLAGRDIGRQPMHARNVGLVFQNYALFPHLTVAENVGFGLRMRRTAPAEAARRVAEALAMVRLSGYERRKPSELSGGQQQRVALARAVVVRPDLLLLDEPLSNLDARLREEMRAEIARLQSEVGITTVLVTHDIHEAFALAQRVAVLRDGVVQQVGTPAEIYRHPRTRFVARFVGACNELEGTVEGAAEGLARVATPIGPVLAADVSAQVGNRAALVVRPEQMTLATAPTGLANDFAGRVERVAFFGNLLSWALRVGDHVLIGESHARDAGALPEAGAPAHVGWTAEATILVAPE